MRALFGSIVALILLGLYIYTVETAIRVVGCVTSTGCTRPGIETFTTGFAMVMSTVSGLVAALVVSELAFTGPGAEPLSRALGPAATPLTQRFRKIVASTFLIVWLLVGLHALLVGTMRHPGVLQPLTDLGQTWLGVAVAAGYAYFGLKPKT